MHRLIQKLTPSRRPPAPPPYDSWDFESSLDSKPSSRSAASNDSQAGLRKAKKSKAQKEYDRKTWEDKLEALRSYDIIFVVDDSTSMHPHWEDTRHALAQLVKMVQKYDSDGIDILFLNHEESGCKLKSEQEVTELFDDVKPCGLTPLDSVLWKAIDIEYLKALTAPKKSVASQDVSAQLKKRNIIVLTDGIPNDRDALVETILKAGRYLEDHWLPLGQLGIQFLQIGRDAGATQYLQRLDDELKEKCGRDIVDVTVYNPEGPRLDKILMKVVLGGINRQIDREGA